MADSSKDIQLRELKDMINDLKKMIKTLQATVDAANKREEALTQERDNLKEEIDLLRKKLFGTSSEKRTLDIPGQLNFFNEAELEQDPEAAKAEDLETILPEKTAKKRKARATDAERFKGVPVEKKYLELSEEEKLCPVCGTPLKEIGEEFVRRELVFVPAKLKVYEYYSKSYECPQCRLQDIPVIKKGKDGRAHMLYGMASAGTVAWVMYQKFCNGLPYYRQEKDWKQYGVEITRATMANWVIRNSEAFFLPMYEYFHRKLLERGFAMADETPLQVLHEPERRAQTKSYMWLFRSGEDGGPPIILYKYSETRAGDNAVDFLHGFKGYLMCDGYSGYNKVPDAKRTACWAHIRRYLTDAIPKGKALDYTQPSVQGMLYINQLFHLEDVIRSKYSSFDAIKKARLEKEKPVVEGFLSWLDQQSPIRGSRMDKAVTYIQNRRSYLSTYLEDGRCSFSNNLSENAIRPFTRMDVIAQNIANANTTRTENGGAYRRKTVVFEEQDTTSFDHMLNGYMSNYEPNGVKVTKIVEDPSDLRLVYEPDNPDANADGYVEYPNVDTVTEMTNLIDSSRSYEASATAFNAAKNIAAKGLELFNS